MLAVLGGPAGALKLTAPLPRTPRRQSTALFLETALGGLLAICAALALARLVPFDLGSHASLGLLATVLIALATVQHRRRLALADGKPLRRILAWIYGLAAAVLLLASLGPMSPVTGGWFASPVQGTVLLNDLLLAYALPGLALLHALRPESGRFVMVLRAAGVALLAVWAAMVIRHLWQGSAGMQAHNGVAQGELYAYTVALLMLGAALLTRALQQGRSDLRKLGMAVVALAAAKAFLVDAAGLSGLLRVVAFLALGLCLAGLAWLNAWAVRQEMPPAADPDAESS